MRIAEVPSRAPAVPGPNFLELVERNARPLDDRHRALWMHEMTRSRLSRRALAYPERLILELANTCNLDCPMCRAGEHGVNPNRFMDRGLFNEIARELFGRIREVRLNGIGEATLLPWFNDCVTSVHTAGLQGELITNLTCDAATMRLLMECRFTVLVSWDAAQPGVFDALRRPSRFETQVEHLRSLVAEARGAGVPESVYLLFTLQPANVEQLPFMVEFAGREQVPRLVVNVLKSRSDAWIARRWEGIVDALGNARELAMSNGVQLFVPDQLGERPLDLDGTMPCAAGGCDRPWREVVIRWNGEIQVCNMFNPYTYGDWRRHGFRRAWGGGPAAAFRRFVNSPARHPYCRGCAYVHGIYERQQERLP